MGLWEKLCLVVLVAGRVVAAGLASAVGIAACLLGCVALGFWANRSVHRDNAHRDQLARDRADSICTFARSFDARQVDTWVIRAVYDALQHEIGVQGRDFPVRAGDDLTRDLRIAPEDVDLSLVPTIAQRTGRALEGIEHNPYLGHVHTVADLVMFFNLQPTPAQQAFNPKLPGGVGANRR